MLALYVRLSVFLTVWIQEHLDRRDERGQASAEYALVMLGAAAIALLLVAWATRTNRVGKLFDTVFDNLLDRV